MCIICVDLAKQRLTANEAKRHLGEMRQSLGEHAAEVDAAIAEAQAATPAAAPAPAPTKP
jgi:hypothetical protein